MSAEAEGGNEVWRSRNPRYIESFLPERAISAIEMQEGSRDALSFRVSPNDNSENKIAEIEILSDTMKAIRCEIISIAESLPQIGLCNYK